jgi:hypothetical protein
MEFAQGTFYFDYELIGLYVRSARRALKWIGEMAVSTGILTRHGQDPISTKSETVDGITVRCRLYACHRRYYVFRKREYGRLKFKLK